MQKSPQRIAVGLSGGVDSATTAWLLTQSFTHVQGIFMRNWHDEDNYCTSYEDEADARQVCDQLGIALEVVDFSKTYQDKVFAHMLKSLQKGHTPNPDILCNTFVKFGVLYDYAIHSLGLDYLATGHYAQILHHPSGCRLHQGLDPIKDQSYFLAKMPRETLTKVLFPLGGMQKYEVRTLAQKAQLAVASKKDSTGICFIGKRPYASFISQYLLDSPGPICTEDGQCIGKHRGLFYYTLGQRKGLAIGGLKDGQEAPWFVIEKRRATNTLLVSQNHAHPNLLSQTVWAEDPYWFLEKPIKNTTYHARIRHGQPLQSCTIAHISNNTLKVVFDAPQRAPTPGQFVVLYTLTGQVLGSACIQAPPQEPLQQPS